MKNEINLYILSINDWVKRCLYFYLSFVSVCLIITANFYRVPCKFGIKIFSTKEVVCNQLYAFSFSSLCKIEAFFWVFFAVLGGKQAHITTSNIINVIHFNLNAYLSLALVSRLCQVVVTKLLWNTSLSTNPPYGGKAYNV